MMKGKRTKELIRRFGAEKCKIIDLEIVKMLMII
jgi:hypothetical protein